MLLFVFSAAMQVRTFFDCFGGRAYGTRNQHCDTQVGANVGTSNGDVGCTAEELRTESLDSIAHGCHRVRVHVLSGRLVSFERRAFRFENIRLALDWKH